MMKELGVPTSEAKNRLDRKLIETWVDQVSTSKVDADRKPIINRDRFVDLLCQAHETQQPLVFVAIGCQDWIKPEWGVPNADFFMGKIRADGKRPKRFVREFASFSDALNSFNIPHRIHFSLSNIEALLHIHLHNMGVTIHNPEEALVSIKESLTCLAENIDTLIPNRLIPFDHTQILQELTDSQDLEELQQVLAGKTNPDYREFLDQLYAFDLQSTATHFVGPKEIGPVWLDIQSFNFEDDVEALSHAATTVAPDMPLLSIFPNAGNWRAAGTPEASFPDKKQVVASILGMNQTPDTSEQWLNKIHRTKDEILSSLLSQIVDDEIVIEDGQQKSLMARLFFMLAFGFDPSNTKAL